MPLNRTSPRASAPARRLARAAAGRAARARRRRRPPPRAAPPAPAPRSTLAPLALPLRSRLPNRESSWYNSFQIFENRRDGLWVRFP